MGSPDFGRICDAVVEEWRRTGVDVAGKVVAELGTGAYPTISLCCYLAGATTVYTDARTDALVIADRLAAHVAVFRDDVEARQRALVEALRHHRDLTAATGGVIQHRAPEGVDIAFVAVGLEAEARRILKPDGIVLASTAWGTYSSN